MLFVYNSSGLVVWFMVLFRKPPTYRKSLTNFITQCCIEYTLSGTGFELTTLVAQFKYTYGKLNLFVINCYNNII